MSEPIDFSWNPHCYSYEDDNEKPIWLVDGSLHPKRGIKRARNFLVSLRIHEDPLFLILLVLKELDYIGADDGDDAWFLDPSSTLMSWISPRLVPF
jgi:hypothetical protein